MKVLRRRRQTTSLIGLWKLRRNRKSETCWSDDKTYSTAWLEANEASRSKHVSIEFLKLASACLSVFVSPPVLIAKQHPHPAAKTQNHQNLNAGSRDKNSTDRQTQKPTNEHRHLVFTFVNYFFLSLFLLYFSFFLSFFFLSSFSIFLSYFITLFLFAFFLSCFLSFCLFKLFLFFLFAPPHNLNHSFYLFNFFSLILSRSSTLPCLVISLFAFSLLFLLFIYLIFTLFFLCHSLSLSLSLNQSIDQPIYPSIYLPLSFSFSFSSSFHFTFLSLSQFLSFFLSFFLHF